MTGATAAVPSSQKGVKLSKRTANGDATTKTTSTTLCGAKMWVTVLVLTNLLVFQLGSLRSTGIGGSSGFSSLLSSQMSLGETSASTLTASALKLRGGVFAIPEGAAEALPSIRLSEDEDVNVDRHIYGGKGDKPHLGGFTNVDWMGISPAVWKLMITYFGVKSVLDVGCGRGISTAWFVTHGVETYCVEGSHDAVEQSVLPPEQRDAIVTEHDFSRGPWWPPVTVDAIWCVEFAEHVGRNLHHNYLPAFRKAAFIFLTHSMWGGWHHVEVHDEVWWKARMESMGFVYSQDLTDRVRRIAAEEKGDANGADENEPFNAQHVWLHMLVFINPVVAALPQHAHLLGEPGCGRKRDDKGRILPIRCGSEEDNDKLTPLPPEFENLPLTEEMDEEWYNIVRRKTKPSKNKKDKL